MEEIYRYRAHVDRGMGDLLDGLDARGELALAPLIELGLNHEQQHQELLLTDLKHAFGLNPLRPVYVADRPASAFDGWGAPVTSRSAIHGDVSFDLGRRSGHAVLLWITDLGEGSVVAIRDVRLTG